jgi:hypothetical protein
LTRPHRQVLLPPRPHRQARMGHASHDDRLYRRDLAWSHRQWPAGLSHQQGNEQPASSPMTTGRSSRNDRPPPKNQ